MTPSDYRICPACGFINARMVDCPLCGYEHNIRPWRLLTYKEYVFGDNGANENTWHGINPYWFLQACAVIREGLDVRKHNALVCGRLKEVLR